jgi:hypothetical protein
MSSTTFPVCLSCSASHVLAVLSFLLRPCCFSSPVLAALYWQPCPSRSVLDVLTRQSCSACPVLTALCWRPVLAALLLLLFSGYPFFSVLAWLSSPGRPVQAALSGQPCPGSPVRAALSGQPCPGSPVRAALSGQPVQAVLSGQFCPGSPVLTVLLCPVQVYPSSLPVLFCLSRSGFPVLAVLCWLSCFSCPFWLSSPFCPALDVLS